MIGLFIVDDAVAAEVVDEGEIDTTRAMFSPSLRADFAGFGAQYHAASLSASPCCFFCIITTFGDDKRVRAHADEEETREEGDDRNAQISFSAR
jgi:hypothetical protein